MDRGEGATRCDGLGALGVGVVCGVSVLLGVVEIHHASAMSTPLGIAAFALLPLLVDAGLFGAGVVLWRSRLDGTEAVRIAGWVVLGAVALGLLSSWTIAHQLVRGLPVGHWPFVAAGSASLGGLVGFLLGWHGSRRRRYDREVAALHAATRGLIHTEDREAVATAVAEAARDVLDFPRNVVRLCDGDRLRPVAITSEAREELGERPVYALDEGLPGRALSTGEPLAVEDFRDVDDGIDRGPHRSALYLPIGDHGTLSIGDVRPGAFEESDVTLASVLATNAASVLDRLKRERELERQNERLDQFASMVSHDLRNPISIAVGRLELFRETGDRSDLDGLGNALARIEQITTDLTGLARHGGSTNGTEPVSLAECADDAWELVDRRAATLSAEDFEVVGEKGQLQAILENLFRNAIDHGGDDVTVRVGPLQDGFYVEDTGTGVPPDVRNRVFEHGFTTGAGGSGVGLTIVRRIAAAQGLDVTLAESSEGGARFEFRESTTTT